MKSEAKTRVVGAWLKEDLQWSKLIRGRQSIEDREGVDNGRD